MRSGYQAALALSLSSPDGNWETGAAQSGSGLRLYAQDGAAEGPSVAIAKRSRPELGRCRSSEGAGKVSLGVRGTDPL